ncbi:ABC transporter ATP-binding protein [Lachnospiraceae bacterium 47-T17]
MILSVLCSIISVFGGFVPFLGVYQILKLFIAGDCDVSQILFWCGFCVAGYLVRLLFFAVSTILSHVSAYTILETIRMEIADKLMKAPLGDVMNKTIGQIKSVVVDRVEAIEPPLAHFIPEATGNVVIPIGIFVFLLVFDWRMALASIATIPLAAIPFGIMTRNFTEKYDAYMKANNHVNSVIVEYVEGIEVVKAFNQASSSYEKFAKAVSSFKDYTVAWYQSTWKLMYLAFSILPSTLLISLPAGLWLFANGSLTAAQLAMCLILSLSIIAPLMRLEVFVNEMKVMEYGIKETLEFINMPELPEIGKKVELTHSDIELEHVSFSYTGKENETVLHDVSLKMPQGSFIALVGPSGGGKSTVARLIARFWDVSGGSIKIGSVNIKDIPLKQLSDTVSFVTQDNFLFNCSLKENIRLGDPSATDEQVYEAAKAACCDEFIGKLEFGYDTPAGDAGKRLSGGEKQRIAIARAILKKAPIVILDEATAFTDPENEDKIQQSIMALTKGKTLLVIAHRLSTIQNADQIVLLQKGRIEAIGSQEELLKNSPLYADMWKAHIGAKAWAVSDEQGVTVNV